MIGNKVDREVDRKVKTVEAKKWCQEFNDIGYYETSAKENVSVDDAFIEMAKMALKRDNENQIFMPDSIGSAHGALKPLKLGKDDLRKNKTVVEKKLCDCWNYLLIVWLIWDYNYTLYNKFIYIYL